MMKLVTTKAQMLYQSKKTQRWKILIQYVIKFSLKPCFNRYEHMTVKFSASVTEEVTKAQTDRLCM